MRTMPTRSTGESATESAVITEPASAGKPSLRSASTTVKPCLPSSSSICGLLSTHHRGVGVPRAQQPAICAGAGAEVDDPARSWHSCQVQNGCDVAEHLGVEIEDALLVLAVRSLVGSVVVVPHRGVLVIHAPHLSAVAAEPRPAALGLPSRPWRR